MIVVPGSYSLKIIWRFLYQSLKTHLVTNFVEVLHLGFRSVQTLDLLQNLLVLVIDLFFLLRLDRSEEIHADRHLLMPNLLSLISRLTFQPSVELKLLKLIL